MSRTIKTLLVEDNPGDAELLRFTLEHKDSPHFKITDAARLSDALQLLQQEDFDLTVLDLGLPDSHGLDTVNAVIKCHPDTAIVVLTGNFDEELGLAAVKAGAQDFLIKGQISNQLLPSVLNYAVERMQAERRVRDSEIQLRTILDALDDEVLLLDKEKRILWPNAQACTNAQKSREEISNLHCYSLWNGGCEICAHCPVDQAFETKSLQARYRITIESKSYDIKAFPVWDQNQRLTSAVVLRTDISKQVSMEEQFRQAQKMEAVGRLAGGIAHDFNNMLSVILGFAELGKKEAKGNPILYKNINEIIQAGSRSAELVKQLLAFSRKQQAKPQLVNCTDVITGSTVMLHRLLGEEITLDLDLNDNLPAIYIDPSQLDQIITNLAINSKDAIDGVGTIRIRTSVATQGNQHKLLPYIKSGHYVLLSVEDNGCGMSKEIMDQVFEPFFTTKKPSQGTGLGMSTTYGIVKQNDGYITISSEEEKGTTVNIYFPAQLGKAGNLEAKKEPATLQGTETILIVEDEESILNLYSMMLSQHGYNVLAESNPEKALSLAREHHNEIDLLISDVIMPVMNGNALRQQIEKIHPGLKTIFISGYTADILNDRGVPTEGIFFLQKPFTKLQLTTRIREILDS